jgi:hypothetical protein
MKNTLLLLCLLPFSGFAQKFPDDYAGTYSGYIHLRPGQADSIPCALIIAPTDDPNRWSNTMIFYDDTPQTNAYEWVRNPETGTWLLDEKDGILITETLIGNTLYATYTVEHMMFYVRTSFGGGAIDYELTVFDPEKDHTSASAENSTEVHSFPVMTVQKGTFKKEK